ncbi:MAG: hypothetical protein IJO83_04010 [Clostridia bacterium]|nr:hypothetical protein [Clostridia bacterium]
MKRKISWIIPLILLAVSLIVLFRPYHMTFDKSVSETRIIFEYEIFGCGSLVRKVLDGGEEISSSFAEEYPDIAVNEVVFSEESDEPRKHLDSENFFSGLAYELTYVVEGNPVGVTHGAPDCCDPNGFAYNENVVEFKVDRWYVLSYLPYLLFGNIFVTECAVFIMWFSLCWLFLVLVYRLYKFVLNAMTGNFIKRGLN